MEQLQRIFNAYKIPATVTDKIEGSRIVTYEIQLHIGARKLAITKYLDEIGMLLGAESIRFINIPEKNAFGIEVSTKANKTVKIKKVLQSDEFKHSDKRLKFVVGESPDGRNVVSSLVDAKHLLIGGTTGSGKSVFINTLLVSLLKQSPSDLRMILIDPKRIELSGYNGIPHLLAPVITEPEQANVALDWVNKEMEQRYKILEAVGNKLNSMPFKDIDTYNDELDGIYESLKASDKKGADDAKRYRLSHIVVVIDELAQLLMTQPKETWTTKGSTASRKKDNTLEQSIIKIAQLGRAAGIHLVCATQRPSADVITPLIKANLPTKIAFAVPTVGNSRVILDRVGAEKLLGRGDMLYMQEDDITPRRVQGAFVGSEDIDRVLNSIRKNNNPPVFDESLMKMLNGNKNTSGMLGIYKPLIDEVNNKMGVVSDVDIGDLEFMYVMDNFVDDFLDKKEEV